MPLKHHGRLWFVVSALLLAVGLLCAAAAHADEIRVVDARGLVRAVKISRGAVRIVVTLEGAMAASPRGECVATNVDGLSAEKRVQVSAKGECVFSDVTGGSWQIVVPSGFSWRVQLYE
jgi:hypothetical protein